MIRFEHRLLPGLGLDDHALLIIPEGQLRVGRERLAQRAQPQASKVDDSIAAAARMPQGVVRVSVFCGRSPYDKGSWGIDDSLGPDEVLELAQVLVRGQLFTYRRLFLAGVSMHIRIDMGGREQLAFRRANTLVRKELERQAEALTGIERELAELDAWLLRNFVFFFAVPLNRLLASTLGANPHSVKQRIKRATRQLEGLSQAARAAAA